MIYKKKVIQKLKTAIYIQKIKRTLLYAFAKFIYNKKEWMKNNN